MYKVSVIIPIYNAEKYLYQCLESVVNQSYKNLEIICVDDCSIDSSLNIINEFMKKDKRIKLIQNSKNIGSALSRNNAIDIASGDLIYFIDSDDYIDEKYLEGMVFKIKEKDCDIVLNLNINTIDSGLIVPYKHPSMPSINDDGEFMDNISVINNAPCFIWARIYKKYLFDKYKLRFFDIHCDDVAFCSIVSLLSDKTFVFSGESYNYRISASSMTGVITRENKKDIEHINAYSVLYDYLKEHNYLQNNLKLFRVYPFMKVDTEDKFWTYKNFIEKIKDDFITYECTYNDLEKYFAYSFMDTNTYGEYLEKYNKVVTIGYIRQRR